VPLLAIIALVFMQSLDGDGVRRAVLAAMDEGGIDASKVEVEVLRVNGLASTDGRVRVELPSDRAPRARTQVRLIRESESGATESGWALLNVLHFDSVAVTVAPAHVGSTFSDAGITFQWMDVTAFRGRPLRLSDLDALPADAIWGRSVAEGRPVRLEDLRLPFAAETGDTVLMEYARSGIVMRLSCRARESGSLGEVIRLYSPETRTTYRARLTGPGTATWIETR
jgi:flagellar basal body P-ring formation protein FlgA